MLSTRTDEIVVQNLYCLKVTLYWNASILQVVSVDSRLGLESHPNGVLHELQSAPTFVAENNVTQQLGKCVLAATSVAPAPSFNGNGNIVRIAFDAINSGDTKLDLETLLYDRPPPSGISMPIDHTLSDGFVSVIVPEISSTAILIVLMVLVTLVVALSKKIQEHSSD